ncbi:MAG: GGDEF domain-containing protein [Rhodobacteraceae bacterium CG17_big_fil_post_rev_8_21_14_2_50_63_15]|nr:GGDEF domain-containing protein [Roseovarius sp.]PIV78255.1 MAG: GGDEF domain-containing protein [Rhodobacteraceae bacterium CG17_big_fil_post_rev_8_21_14_2_50_63_15]
MLMQVRTRGDVRRFAMAISAIVVIASIVLRYLVLPSDLAGATLIPGSMMALMLAAPIAYAVGQRLAAIHHLSAQLEHALHHDLLTGVCTRISFYGRAAQLGAVSCAVIVADIDHFKGFNDHYGHPAGDQALRHFAAILASNCREDDLIARFGGEEFVLVLRNTTLTDGFAAACRLCQRIRESPVVIGGRARPLTASFGVAALPPGGAIEIAIQQADRALYRAKRSGRDRACVYDLAQDAGPLPLTLAAE